MSHPAVALPIPQFATERPGQSQRRGDPLAVLFPVYAAMAKCFDWGQPPCQSIPEDAERMGTLQRWLEQVDERLEAYQLRKFFQTEDDPTEEKLRHLIRRYLTKPSRTLSDRDKLDFLLVQYVYCCRPVSVAGKEITPQDIAVTLQPVLGEVSETRNSCLEPLEDILCQVKNSKSLNELFEHGCLEQGRWLKDSVGDRFWEGWALVAFTWFNSMMRRGWFQLVYADLQAIRSALGKLEQLGVHEVDCRRAQLSATEPSAHLHEICDEWKESFGAPYKAGHPLAQIAALRLAVEGARTPAIPYSSIAAASSGSSPAEVPSALASEPAIVGFQASEPARNFAGGVKKAPPTPQPIPEELETLGPAEAPPPNVSAEFHENRIFLARAALQNCLGVIRDQLKTPSVRQNRASGGVLYSRTRLLLHSWEIEAFGDSDGAAAALQLVVAARALLGEAQEEFQLSGDSVQLDAIIELAEQQVSELKKSLAQARREQSVEIAANLSASSKRLLASIAKAKKLRPVAAANRIGG